MKKRGCCAVLLILFYICLAGCSAAKQPDVSKGQSDQNQSINPSEEVPSAPYPVDVENPFEEREFSVEECGEVLEVIFPEESFAFAYETIPKHEQRYDGPWYIFQDENEGSYGVNPKGGKLMYYQPAEKSYTRTETIELGEAQKLAEEVIQKLAPGKFDLSQMQLTHNKFGFFTQQSNVFNWISVVDGVDIRHEACVRLDEYGNVGVVFLEYNYGFDPQVDELKIEKREEAEERLVESLIEDPMITREIIHVTDCRLTVDSQNNHQVIWRFHYELESPADEPLPYRASIDAATGEKL